MLAFVRKVFRLNRLTEPLLIGLACLVKGGTNFEVKRVLIFWLNIFSSSSSKHIEEKTIFKEHFCLYDPFSSAVRNAQINVIPSTAVSFQNFPQLFFFSLSNWVYLTWIDEPSLLLARFDASNSLKSYSNFESCFIPGSCAALKITFQVTS